MAYESDVVCRELDAGRTTNAWKVIVNGNTQWVAGTIFYLPLAEEHPVTADNLDAYSMCA